MIQKKSDYHYNSWPLGKLPLELQRKEPDIIREIGYDWKDPRDIVEIFEEKLAKFAGSKYAVATDSCTSALELSFRRLLNTNELDLNRPIIMPDQTYISAYILLHQLGFKNINLEDIKWSGIYEFSNTYIYDSAVRWSKNMYIGENALQCLSFNIKKRIPTGKMGAILLDLKEDYDWLKLAVYDGRNLKTPYDSDNHLQLFGYHKYATPEDCARTIILMDCIKDEGDSASYKNYPKISEMIKNIK